MPEPIFASVQCISWPLQVHLHLSQINKSGVRTLPGEMQTLQHNTTNKDSIYLCQFDTVKANYQVPPI